MGFADVVSAVIGGTGAFMDYNNYVEQKSMNEWQKAKQKEQWEREDTAYQRTAQDMLNAGLNPLSMQGTDGAGELISPEAPQMSNQNTANNAVMMNNIFSQIENSIQGKQQRDLLQSQIDKQELENIAYARDNGLVYKPKFKLGLKPSKIGKKTYSVTPEDLGGDNYSWTTNGIQVGENPKVQVGNKSAYLDLNDPYARKLQKEYRELEKDLFDSWDNSHDVEYGNHTNDTQIERNLTTLQNWLDKDKLLNLLIQLKETGIGFGQGLLEDFGFSSKKRK